MYRYMYRERLYCFNTCMLICIMNPHTSSTHMYVHVCIMHFYISNTRIYINFILFQNIPLDDVCNSDCGVLLWCMSKCVARYYFSHFSDFEHHPNYLVIMNKTCLVCLRYCAMLYSLLYYPPQPAYS